MLKRNPLQFSVVREDPEIELSLFREINFEKPIIVGSGGCTILAMASEFPKLPITIIEPNPAQIKLIKEKIKKIKTSSATARLKLFGVGLKNPGCLIEKGNFESLFRSLREFIFEFIADEKKILGLLKNGTEKKWNEVFIHPYWPVAFDLFFNNSILRAMFGPAAIQHAPSESYSRYFQEIIEKGLLRSDRATNYFLYHIFVGHYPKEKKGWPSYLVKPPKSISLKVFQCMAQDVPSYSDYDFVGLSNIFDWSSEKEIKAMASKLDHELSPNAIVLYRQLNNSKNFRSFFGSNFQWLSKEATSLHQKDRSLFYSSIHIARKIK